MSPLQRPQEGELCGRAEASPAGPFLSDLKPAVVVPCSQKREQKSEQTNGLPERPSKRSVSPAVELELNAGPLRLDGLPPGAGAAGPGLRVAQVRLLDRRTSSRPSSRPGTPTSNTSSTPTPSEEQNDGEEEAAEPEDEIQGPELEGASLSAPTPRLLKRPFQLLIAAAMERNPTQFQLPSELTCTTALPGQPTPCLNISGPGCRGDCNPPAWIRRQQQTEEEGGAAGEALQEASTRAGLQRPGPAAAQSLLRLQQVGPRRAWGHVTHPVSSPVRFVSPQELSAGSAHPV